MRQNVKNAAWTLFEAFIGILGAEMTSQERRAAEVFFRELDLIFQDLQPGDIDEGEEDPPLHIDAWRAFRNKGRE